MGYYYVNNPQEQIRASLAIPVPSIPADFPFGFVAVDLDTQSICVSIRLAEQKIITESVGTFITRQALSVGIEAADTVLNIQQ